MKPTIGRIVHYQPMKGAPRPAIVLEVHDDGATLRILGPFGDCKEFRVPFANGYTPGHWSWPPRQEEQTA